MRISKRIKFNEHMNLEILAEGFNIFNRANVTAVNTAYISSITFGTTAQVGTLTYNPQFGTPTTTGFNNTTTLAPRQVQLGLKFHF